MYEYRIKYRDPDGLEYALNDSLRTFLPPGGLLGFSLPRGEVPAARRPYRDGAYALAGPYTPARELGIALTFAAQPGDTHADLEDLRRALRRSLSAKKSSTAGWLILSQDDTTFTREIQAYLVEAGDPERDGPFVARQTFIFWAETPWFRDPDADETTIALGHSSGLAFPITFPITWPASAIDDDVNIENPGDVEAWPTIRVNGPGQDPSIENTTQGATLELSGVTLDSGDYLDIDMDAATINFYDSSAGTTTSVLNYLTAASEFWSLARGDNALHVEMSAAGTGSIVISFYPLYEAAI